MLTRHLRGYLGRKRVLRMLMVKRTTELADYWGRINKIVLGHFQRRVRKVYFAYKVRKAEKERLRKEKLANQKGKKGFRKTTTMANLNKSTTNVSKSAPPKVNIADQRKQSVMLPALNLRMSSLPDNSSMGSESPGSVLDTTPNESSPKKESLG